MFYLFNQVFVLKNDDFLNRIAYHQRIAIDAALIELGCGSSRDNSPRTSISSAGSFVSSVGSLGTPIMTSNSFLESPLADRRIYQVRYYIVSFYICNMF